jgi:hypothetical protein
MWLIKAGCVVVIATIASIVLYRMNRPSTSRVCDHLAELAPNSVVQPKIDRAFAEVPEAAKRTSPVARCEAYFNAVTSDPHPTEDISERSRCVLDAKTRSSVAACLEK